MSRDLKHVTSVALALQNKSHSLAFIRRERDEAFLEALIKLQLVYMNEVLDLKRPLKEAQIDILAQEIVAQYAKLTMTDIYLIFRRAITGHYGDFYESITIPKVMKWFKEYQEERLVEAERISMNQHAQGKQYIDPNRAKTDDLEYRQVYNDFIQNRAKNGKYEQKK